MTTNPHDPWPHEHGEADDGVFHADQPRHDHHAHLIGEPQPADTSRRPAVLIGVALLVVFGALGWVLLGSDLIS